MLRQLIFREILENVKSFRFMLSFLIVLSAFVISSTLFIGKYELAVEDYRENQTQNLITLEEKSKEGLDQVARYKQRLLNPPAVLGFVCTGFDVYLPNAIYVDAFSVRGMDHLSRSNFLVPQFKMLDYVFIIGILLSFVALALSFDGISREKEDGTLRLIMTNALPRYKVIMAKYLATVFVLMIPVTVGILLNLNIVTVSGSLSLSSKHWVQILLIYVISFIYLSGYVLLGLFISSLTHRSATSLVFCLVFWVVLVLLIPNMGGLLAQMFHPMFSRKELEEKVNFARNEVWGHYPSEAQSFSFIDRYRPAHQLRAAAFSEMLEVEIKMREAYFNEQLQQVKSGRNWTRISPTAVYQYVVESIANVGIPRFLNFRSQLKNYREQLIDFVKKKDASDPESPHWINPDIGFLFSTNPVEYAEIPKFDYRSPNIEAILRESLMDIFLLLIINLILFNLSIVCFLRLDVR